MNNGDLIKSVAKLNNEGADLLALGHANKSFKCFHSAARCVTNILEERGITAEFNPHGPGTFVTNSGIIITTLTAQAEGCDPCFYSIKVPNFGSEQDTFYIHGKAITIMPDRNMENMARFLMELSCCYAIISFNMAVLFHLKGNKEGNTSAFMSASRLYDKSIRIISSNYLYSDYMRMLMIMAMNNKSHIYFELNDFQRCHALLDCLQLLLRSSRDPLVDDSRDLKDTRLNISVYNQAQLAPSA